MEAVSIYVRTVAFFMIFSAFVEIAAPSGAFKKYVRLILGLVLITLVLEPVYGAFEGGLQGLRLRNAFADGVLDTRASERERLLYEASGVSFSAMELKLQLAELTSRIIYEETGFRVLAAEVVINEDNTEASGGLWVISEIHATVLASGAGENEKNENSEKNENIERALFGEAANINNRDNLKQAAVLKIKNSLHRFYNIKLDNIHITVQDE